MTATGHLQHHPGAHRAADVVDVGQSLSGGEALDRIGEGGDRHLARERRGLAEPGEVDRDDLAVLSQRRDDRVPGAMARAKTVIKSRGLPEPRRTAGMGFLSSGARGAPLGLPRS